ncbi:hypothetical protein IMSHALPRED_002086 [Imshaugia aleurites]|uniref:Amino acid transporter n=1 Tax=Imshaugia aleurites TaxID=172621 RepID=A0A8H3J4X6_9LECA|nr:hypothetical protein IMSHALPRED_002086 [Imshaugia aleurites]
MAEIELQGARKASDCGPQDHGLGKTFSQDNDEQQLDVLCRLGKRPILKRNFGFLSILGFICTILITWEASFIIFDISILKQWRARRLHIRLSLGLGRNIGNMCFIGAPTAGGQYHWVSVLAPPGSQKILSYMTGWLTVLGWQANFATANFVSSAMLQGLIVLTRPNYDPKPYQHMLLFWAVMAFAVFINVLASTLLPKFEGFILVLHIVGYFAILLPLLILGEHQDPHQVFGLWLNLGKLPTQGTSFMVGLLGPVFMFLGADGAVHMSEEIQNAPRIVPWSILFSIVLNGVLALSMMIATLFVTVDLQSSLNSPTGYAFMDIFVQATGSVAGATIMACIVTVLQLCANVGLLAACSRMSWSFARDRGLPGYKILVKINPRTSIPVTKIVATAVVSTLLSLIILGSSTAFNNIVSIAVAGLSASYALAIGLLLWRRTTGSIRHSTLSRTQLTNTPGFELSWGPWHMPGVLGPAVNLFAIIYVLVILFFSFWPPDVPLDATNMNYTILVTGVVLIFSVVWYFAWAKRDYKGPVIDAASAQ